MTALRLSLACGDYDRTRPLLDGRVGIEGCEVVPFALPPEETFFRAFRHAEFDVAELSFSTYLITTAKDICPYVAIPAFVSRSFRHSAIYVRKDGPVRRPEDLAGRRVGVPEYQVTAAVWVRAMLQEDHGVAPSDIHWITGGVEDAGRHEKISIALPNGIRVTPAPDGKTLGRMLEEGEIDALVCPRAPSAYARGRVVRLFADPVAAAKDYFQRRRIFPVMHVVGIRNELVATCPWLPSSIYKGFLKAREMAVRAIDDTTALSVTLPWLVEAVEDTRSTMGADYWPYGIEGNEPTIDAFLRHHHAQGLSDRAFTPGDVFHPATLERFKI